MAHQLLPCGFWVLLAPGLDLVGASLVGQLFRGVSGEALLLSASSAAGVQRHLISAVPAGAFCLCRAGLRWLAGQALHRLWTRVAMAWCSGPGTGSAGRNRALGPDKSSLGCRFLVV